MTFSSILMFLSFGLCYSVTGWFSLPSQNIRFLLLDLYKIFRGKNDELCVFGRLAAGAFAGMTSTFGISQGIFSAGSGNSSKTIVANGRAGKKPKGMEKAQAEMRKVYEGKCYALV